MKSIIRSIYYGLKGIRNYVLIRATYKIHSCHKQYIKVWEMGLSFFCGGNTYTVESVDNYCNTKKIPNMLIKDNRIGHSYGLVYNIADNPQTFTSKLPNLQLTLFSDIIVSGGNDCLIDYEGKIVISDVSANMNTEVYENANGFIISQQQEVAICKKIKHISVIDMGISVCSCFSNNYYHSLYDSLLKVLIIDSLIIDSDVPLIVDSNIKNIPQLYEAFLLFNRKRRDVIWVENNDRLIVKKLYYLNSIHIQPPQIKRADKICFSDFKYDISALQTLRNACMRANDHGIYPQKIFLSRKSHTRRKYNEEDVIKIVERHGFTIVHTEECSFKQQISIFNQAEIIVGPTGAAFTNILFCHPGAVAICFMGKEMNIPIFSAGAYVANAKLLYFIGSNTSLTASSHEIQSDYKIDALRLDSFLSEVEKTLYNVSIHN